METTQKNEFNISGRVVFVGQKKFFTEKLSKRILVLEVWKNNKYHNEVSFDFINDNMDQLRNIREKDWVNIDFCLTGRKKIGGQGVAVWYNNIEGLTCTKQ